MKIYCSDCGKIIPQSTARVVIDNQYVCGDCVYKREMKR